MTITETQLRQALAARADLHPAEVSAARARLDGAIAGVEHGRPDRRWLAVVVTAVLLVSIGTVAVAAHRPARSAPAGAPSSGIESMLTRYGFDVDESALAVHGLSVDFGGSQVGFQQAFVTPTGVQPSPSTTTAVVEVATDPNTLGVAVRPVDAVAVWVGGTQGWTAPHTPTDVGWDTVGITGWRTTWSDRSGLIVEVIAADRPTLAAVAAAVRVWQARPVVLPFALGPSAFPAGCAATSTVAAEPGLATVVLRCPDTHTVQITVGGAAWHHAAFVDPQPLVGPYRVAVPRAPGRDLVTDGTRVLQIDVASTGSGTGWPSPALADLATLVGSLRFAPGGPDGGFLLSDAVPVA